MSFRVNRVSDVFNISSLALICCKAKTVSNVTFFLVLLGHPVFLQASWIIVCKGLTKERIAITFPFFSQPSQLPVYGSDTI